MQLKEALNLITAHKQKICSQFHVKHLSLFGSLARDEATPESDVDVLVEFDSTPNFDNFMGLKIFLEDLLHAPIDLVTVKALKPKMRPLIEKEVIHVT